MAKTPRLQYASGTDAGILTAGTQDIAGLKNFPSANITMKADGSVGFGTPNPGGLGDGGTPYAIHVNKPSSLSGTNGAMLLLSSNNTTDGYVAGGISFGTLGTASSEKRLGFIVAVNEGSSATSPNGQIIFGIFNAGVYSAAMTIKKDGRVTAPSGYNSLNGGPVSITTGSPVTLFTMAANSAYFVTVSGPPATDEGVSVYLVQREYSSATAITTLKSMAGGSGRTFTADLSGNNVRGVNNVTTGDCYWTALRIK